MAKLPNETALGGAPSFRTGRAVVSGDELGLEERGKAMQRFGRSLQGVGDDLKRADKEDEALDLIRADAHYKTSMIQAEREFDNDPDYHTYDKRFSERSKKITDEAAGLIRNPTTREKFTLHSSVSTERARDGILTKGENRKRETRFVALGDSLSTYSKIYTDPATDETTKLRTLQDMRNAVTLSERQGLLSPQQAQTFRRIYIENTQIDDAAVRLETDPEGLIRDLISGEPPQGAPKTADALVEAVIQTESGGRADARSPKGALGLMQVMPETAKEIAAEIDPDAVGLSKNEWTAYLKDPEVSRKYGTHYLNKMMERYKGDTEAALIAYNGGPSRADAWLEAGRDDSVIPKESANYYKKVLKATDQPGRATSFAGYARGEGQEAANAGRFTGAAAGYDVAADLGIQPRFNRARSLGLDGAPLASVRTKSGAKFAVASPAAQQIQGFLNDLEATGYKIDPKTSGGYNYRNIAGTNRLSQHAHGGAIDINWNENKFDQDGTNNLPPEIGKIADKWGMSWGGYFQGKNKDTMHFEVSRLLGDTDVAGVTAPAETMTDATAGIGQPTARYAELAPKTRVDLLGKAQKKVLEMREAAADRQRAELILSGELLVDPSSKDDQGVIDRAFTGLADQLAAADPQAAAAATLLAQQTGYIPDEALGQLRALSINGTAEQKTFAYETAANIMREKPGIFEGGDKVKRLKDDASMYQTYTTEMGLTAPQAVARIDELRTPEFEKRRKAMKEEIEGGRSFVSKITASDLTSVYDGWFTAEPELGSSPRRSGVVLDAYRDLVKEHYIRTGDEEVAKSMALKDLQRTYNVSNVADKKRLMRHPPELIYPAIEPPDGGTPDHSYFTRQLAEDVKARAGVDIPMSDIFIEPIPQTDAEIRAGRRDPAYGVYWMMSRDGIPVMETAPGMVFRADVKGEMERQTAAREERLRSVRQGEVDRQNAIENDPARRATKAIIRGVRGALTNPEVLTDEAPNLSVAP